MNIGEERNIMRRFQSDSMVSERTSGPAEERSARRFDRGTADGTLSGRARRPPRPEHPVFLSRHSRRIADCGGGDSSDRIQLGYDREAGTHRNFVCSLSARRRIRNICDRPRKRRRLARRGGAVPRRGNSVTECADFADLSY